MIWSEGYPVKISASNEKNRLIAQIFQESNFDYSITSKLYYKDSHSFIYKDAIFFNTKSNSKLNFILSIFKEIKYLYLLKKRYKKVILLISYTNFFIYCFYTIICRLINVKIILNIMEWHIAQFEKFNYFKKINPYLFDKYAFRFSNGSIVISDFIAEKLNKQINKKPILKIPVLADIEQIDSINSKDNKYKNHFVYCGNIGYIEIIEMIIEAFSLFSLEKRGMEYNLLLILNGDLEKNQKFKKLLNNDNIKNRVKILTDLEYEELICFYKNAEILLIPLRDTDQDKARYPHKIGEYSLCAKPIISDNIGQVGIDFVHNLNIYFSEDFSISSLANSMFELSNNIELRENLGINARLNGEKLFNKKNYIKITKEFIDKI